MNSCYTASCGTCIAPAIIITQCTPNQNVFSGFSQQPSQYPITYQPYSSQYAQPYASQPTTCFTNCTTTCGPNLMQSYPNLSYQSTYQPQQQLCLPQCPQPQYTQMPICPPTFQNFSPQSTIQNYPPCLPNVQCFTNYQPFAQNCLPAPGSHSTFNSERSKEIITVPYLPYSRQNNRGYPLWD